MLRAALFRVFSDQPCDVALYAALGRGARTAGCIARLSA